MPDIQSELSKVLQSWDEQPTTMTPQSRAITTNSTRRTFNFIRDNPGVTRAKVIDELEKQGTPVSSSRSLVSTFVLNGNVRESGGLLYANQQDYAPLKRPDDKPVRKLKYVIEPTVAEPVAPEVVEPPAPVADDVKSMIAKMNVMQAREMYDELRTIFGG